ncbi:outer membrane protein assembly factor BamB family protein [Urbifossiella limnaea]|uniref:Outer membrane biogenesis protein BamB n=1 Tax=Urbifossiella limnaea TaxID=2528023 RepID=A0A517XX26_9BACT|nr:PQQ-binding-like beta-propeller repeat protein [Urbifossiella limnaea]QDU22045.1 outer membrane biogenesis protein BamB [Urbifossiella limnaea]
MARVRLPLLALLLLAVPAQAVILRLVSLQEVLDGEQLIFVAAVDSVLPERPALVLKLDEKLKGDPPFDRLPVNMTGDDEAKKGEHTKLILDRLDGGRKVVVFASKKGKRYNAMAFTEGTWFSLQGVVDDDGKTVRWAFLHGEPYLRRTFKGTTAELRQICVDGLAKKAPPPAPNEKEAPGFGPAPKKEGGGSEGGGRRGSVVGGAALFGVIPSLALVGPLAIIAALFPGAAASMAVAMKRWRAFLVVASVNSTAALVYWLVREYWGLPDWWLFTYQGFTLLLVGFTFGGMVWADRRYRRLVGEDPTATTTPTRKELRILLGVVAVIGLLVASARFFGPWSAAVDFPMREFALIGVSLLASAGYVGYRRLTAAHDLRADGTEPPLRVSISGELAGLSALFTVTLAAALVGGLPASTTTPPPESAGGGVRLLDVQVYELPDANQVMSSVTVNGDRLYVGAAKSGGFGSDGFVFALDRDSKQVAWKFAADGDLMPVFSTPTVSGGKVFVGEGLHTDKGSRLFALDAATGKTAWPNPFPTTSHTEGQPRVANGRLYFAAGDDGLICADAAKGTKVWQFAGKEQKLHIDGAPAVSGKRVFLGSGLYTLARVAVDADTGNELWRQPQAYRSFGPPLATGEHVLYGIGTGNMTNDTFAYAEEGTPSEAAPGGAVVCASVTDGKTVWEAKLPRSVHTPLAADALFVYVACRDGSVYCFNRATGAVWWSVSLGSTFTAGPAVAADDQGRPTAVYAATPEGRVACLNPYTGKAYWVRELAEVGGRRVTELYSTPAVVQDGRRRSVYVGAQLESRTRSKSAAVFRFDDETGE